MATIGAINVAVRANTGQFNKGMKRVRTIATATVRALRSKFTLLAGALGVGSVGYAASRAATDIDKLAKVAKRLGADVGGLSEWHLVAEQAGISTTTFDMALQRMTRRVAEAAKGTGEAQNALKELGIDAVALSAMSADEQFATLLDSLRKIQSPADRLRLAFKLFDSEGAALVQTLGMTEEQIEAVRKRANDLGLVVTAKQAASVETMNDRLREAKSLFSGIFRQVIVDLAPSVTKVAAGFVEWAVNTGLVRKSVEFVRAGFNWLVDNAAAIVQIPIEMWKFTVSTFEVLKTIGSLMMQIAGVDMFAASNEGLSGISWTVGKILDLVQVVKLGFMGFRTLVLDIMAAMTAGIAKLFEMNANILEAILPASISSALIQGTRAAADDFWARSAASQAAFEKEFTGKTPSEQIAARQQQITEALKINFPDLPEFKDAVNTFGQGAKGIEKKLPEAMKFGTTSAVSFLNKQQADPQKKLVKNGELQLGQLKAINANIQKHLQPGVVSI